MENKHILMAILILLLTVIVIQISIKEDNRKLELNKNFLAELILQESEMITYLNNNCQVTNYTNETTTLVCLNVEESKV
jgi:hypothetical protein